MGDVGKYPYQRGRICDVHAWRVAEFECHPKLVSRPFLLCQEMVFRLHSVKQSLLINERNLYNSLPFHLFPVHIKLKIPRVEINYWRVAASHKLMIWHRNNLLASVG